MLGTEARQAVVPLCAILLFLLVTRRGIADSLLPVFGLQILCYAVAFSVSSFDPLYAIEGAFRRITMTLFPAFTLEKPIIDGSGTVRIDDTIWRVAGPDAPAGSRVRIVQADGASLTVTSV